jgi:hypothetical protein
MTCTPISLESTCIPVEKVERCAQARLTAALFLKNNVITAARQVHGGQQNVALDIAYVKACTLAMLQSTARPLRQAAGTLAVSVLTAHPLAMWPDLVRTPASCEPRILYLSASCACVRLCTLCRCPWPVELQGDQLGKSSGPRPSVS